MATVDKNFRIKNGLVVEGSTATVNGNDILTKDAGDSYIINLIGGTATSENTPSTVVKRDANGNFSAGTLALTEITVQNAGSIYEDSGLIIQSNGGYSIDILANQDVNITSSNGDINLNPDGSVRISGDVVATQGYADYVAGNAQSAAVTSANGYTDTIAGQLATSIQDAQQAAISDAHSYTDDAINYEVTNRNNAITNAISGEASDRDNAITSAINTEVTNRNDAIATAKQEAIDYADGLIDDASNASNEVWSAYKTNTEISLAEGRANTYTDDAVANVVGAAPALLDTLQELATALQDNPDVIQNIQDVAAGKQDTLTAGSNIDITGSTISVTGLNSGNISDFNSAALSATSAAYDVAGAAASAQSAAETTAQNALDSVLAGDTGFTEVSIDWMVKHVGSYSYANNMEQVAYEWNHNTGASAKFLVRLKNGIHSQVSEVLLTRDDANNIAITEYGIVTTNGILGDITAGMNGNNIQLKVNPTHDTGTEIFVSGTLLRYAD